MQLLWFGTERYVRAYRSPHRTPPFPPGYLPRILQDNIEIIQIHSSNMCVSVCEIRRRSVEFQVVKKNPNRAECNVYKVMNISRMNRRPALPNSRVQLPRLRCGSPPCRISRSGREIPQDTLLIGNYPARRRGGSFRRFPRFRAGRRGWCV